MNCNAVEDAGTHERFGVGLGSWMGEAAPDMDMNTRFLKFNARAVEFVAKPGKVQELRDCFCGEILEFLKTQRGFAGVAMLTSHKEPRRILIMSMWKTARDATDNCWERTRVVRRLMAPLVDVCSGAQTYETLLPRSLDAETQLIDMQV